MASKDAGRDSINESPLGQEETQTQNAFIRTPDMFPPLFALHKTGTQKQKHAHNINTNTTTTTTMAGSGIVPWDPRTPSSMSMKPSKEQMAPATATAKETEDPTTATEKDSKRVDPKDAPRGSRSKQQSTPKMEDGILSQTLFTTQDVIDAVQAPQATDWWRLNPNKTVSVRSTQYTVSNRIYIVLKPNSIIHGYVYEMGTIAFQLGPLLKQYVDKTEDKSVAQGADLRIAREGVESYTITMLSTQAIVHFLKTVDTAAFVRQYFYFGEEKEHPTIHYNTRCVYVPTPQDIEAFEFNGNGVLASRCVALDDSPVIQTSNVCVKFTLPNATYDPTADPNFDFKAIETQVLEFHESDDLGESSVQIDVTATTAIPYADVAKLTGYVFGIAEVILPPTSATKHKILSQLVGQSKLFQEEYRGTITVMINERKEKSLID